MAGVVTLDNVLALPINWGALALDAAGHHGRGAEVQHEQAAIRSAESAPSSPESLTSTPTLASQPMMASGPLPDVISPLALSSRPAQCRRLGLDSASSSYKKNQK